MTRSRKSITDSELESARQQWLIMRPRFEEFGNLLKKRLEEAIANTGTHAAVSSRAKEMHSLIKKLIAKPYHTYDTLPDKAGVRVCVRFTSDLAPAVAIAQALFKCAIEEKGRTGDRVGYSSTHLDAVLPDTDPDAGTFPPAMFRAEIQIRTMAQHLWSEMDHDIYKGKLVRPDQLKRSVALLAGLLELADNEFDRIHEVTLNLPKATELRILQALERQYFKLTSKRSNKDLSLAVIKVLAPLYSPSPRDWDAYFEKLFTKSGKIFKTLFDTEDQAASAFLYQPEALLIYDRLRKDIYGLRRVWGEHFPPEELQRFAEKFGEWV
jgi:ppGpp synthetase/RelA/SpoT-type nucleotidyltranferase